MTTRLYYTEPYRRDFRARVVACDEADGRIEVTLDQTAFYPSSGGQPFDTGTLGGVTVLDVVDRDDGGIAHVVSGRLRPGDEVAGEIDWARRFDHMQQHTGQHVLSAAFDRLFGARTESFHMGAAASTIDLAIELTPAQIARAEDEANRVVWEDRPVAIRFVTAEEAAALPLRKEPARGGELRLIDVEDFDLSACGGTHVARTGGIGAVAISRWEKFRGGMRVEFLCGSRAITRFRAWRDAFAATQRLLSVSPDELPGAIERLQAEGKSLQKGLRGFQERLAVHEARALAAAGTRTGDHVIVAEALEGWDAQALKAMAVAVTAAEPAAAVALFTASRPALAVVARGADAKVDAGQVLKALVSRFGGKGGGKPDLAQGGGLDADGAALTAAARELLGAS